MTPPLVAACAPADLSDIAHFVLAIAAASLALLRDTRYTLNIAKLLINVAMSDNVAMSEWLVSTLFRW
jgi:hypothetical protein